MDINNVVQAEIKTELKNYRTHLKNSLKSDIRILDIISDFVHSKKRSEIIPTLTLLTRKLFGEVNDNTHSAAVLIDLLYTATLIHDDVEEYPIEKHSLIPINNLWKSKLSVLMGDYFLAKGLLLSVKNKSYDLLELVSNSVKEITEGELYKLYNNRSLSIKKKDYLHNIGKKLPALFSACTTSAAILSHADSYQTENLQKFAYGLGMAMQLNSELNHLKIKRQEDIVVSFPLICSLEKCTAEEHSEFLTYLASNNRKDVTEILKFIKIKGGDEVTIKAIQAYKINALEALSWVKESGAKKSLISLVQNVNIN
jgi:octaprenyl-diphosphate synthase